MSDELEFGDYMTMLKRHWLVSFLIFILVFGGILAYTFLTVPTYEAKSLVAITGQDQANFLFGSSASPKVADIETQRILIQSSNVMYSVYSRHDYKTFKFSVNTVKNTNVIEIDVQSTSAENAATIANDIAESYIKYTTEARMQEAKNSIDFISGMISQYDAEINALNVKVAYYKGLGSTIDKADQITYANVQRELVAKNKIYDNLLAKREEALLTTSLSSTNVKVMEYAVAPLAPIKPNLQLNIILGLILGLGAAFGTAMIAHSNREKKPVRKF